MSSHITQAVALANISDRITEAEQRRLVREFREARRTARRGLRRSVPGSSTSPVRWAQRIGYAGAR